MATLDEFESRLQSLLEIHLVKYLPGYKVEDGIAQRLAASMHSHLKKQNGVTHAPNIYMIVAHPSTLTRWNSDPRLYNELANALYTAGNEAGFQFASMPAVTATADTNLSVDDIKILVSFNNQVVGETQGMPVETPAELGAERPPANAFLIIGGTQIFPLSRSVINIGRRLDNHVVIDDPRVSRSHAQLRIVKDHFVIFDLNSSGGTFVNGQRTNQSILYPGDVISLAGITLIFGQDIPPARSSNDGHTEPGSPYSADRPTAIMKKEDFEK
jgi:pSer/pThr/pTyr-binding forkhead associated (FHA) protein